MLRSLVGSEMCIRDRLSGIGKGILSASTGRLLKELGIDALGVKIDPYLNCLLYTSDAADDLLCVDLGGRRIIKKKKTTIPHS